MKTMNVLLAYVVNATEINLRSQNNSDKKGLKRVIGIITCITR